ncbi:AMP-binding protein [Solwaraspora sp. WMMA2080]|uniref:AMP-binding protein n=1 Tax=unclassified Solwaraspora TaxID=2627926 RepID=UPI00248BC293|nr:MULTISPECIES: AMP-binding protein [unclassified Solwaraspora]WBB98687.1 AMP-binding protein [Solwaraspora sp. WMMA2059]WBC22760.1 AMP-binding protein [Solwaraspora sp. WMMA2080]
MARRWRRPAASAAGMIGAVPWDALRDQARRNAAAGAPAVPDAAAGLADLPVTGPDEIFAVSHAVTRRTGALLLSSGGTTGQPKLTYVAYHQAIDRLLQQWRPLVGGDLLLNLFTPGRLWASHYYMQELAGRCGADVAPFGPITPEEVDGWLPTLRRLGVNAVAGTPTALADLARGVLDAGAATPIAKIIWMAEPWTEEKATIVRKAFPQVQLWGNYGSVETYVIATNTPACDPSVLHLMPDQVLELDDAGALLSRVGDGWTVPTVRYRLGDRVAAATCVCGRPDALRVLGRADDAIKLHGALVGIGTVLDIVRAAPGVRDAQLLLRRAAGERHSVSAVTVHYTGDADPAAVRTRLLHQFYDLGVVARHHPTAVAVEQVPRLRRVDRTNKIPPMIWLEPTG